MTNFESLLTSALADKGKSELLNRASLMTGLCSLASDKQLSGAERELHEETCRRAGDHPDSIGGLKIPFAQLVPRRQRDLSVGNFGAGGATVQTNVASDPVELLLNRATAFRLGATKMTGLRGSVAIPRVTSAPTVQMLPEAGTANKSNPTFDQILLAPHKATVTCDITRQFLIQSSLAAEEFIKNLFADLIALKIDELFYYGQGSQSEPLGILNTPGVGSVVFGGAATFDKMVSFETALAAANADTTGNLAFVTSPSVRAKLKTAAKIPTGGSAIYPAFIWEDGNWQDDSGDGKVNSYRAAVSNQIQNNQVIFGNFRDSVVGIFGGDAAEVIINPYSRDVDAAVRITMHVFLDVAVRHAVSFCASADGGAQ